MHCAVSAFTAGKKPALASLKGWTSESSSTLALSISTAATCHDEGSEGRFWTPQGHLGVHLAAAPLLKQKPEGYPAR